MFIMFFGSIASSTVLSMFPTHNKTQDPLNPLHIRAYTHIEHRKHGKNGLECDDWCWPGSCDVPQSYHIRAITYLCFHS